MMSSWMICKMYLKKKKIFLNCNIESCSINLESFLYLLGIKSIFFQGVFVTSKFLLRVIYNPFSHSIFKLLRIGVSQLLIDFLHSSNRIFHQSLIVNIQETFGCLFFWSRIPLGNSSF